MNHPELSSNLAVGAVTRPQSLFKLPAIFTLIVILSFVIFDIIGYHSNVSRYPSFYRIDALYTISDRFFHYLLNYSIWYFLLATLMFATQRMYQLTVGNIVKVCIIGVIYGGVSLFSMTNQIVYPVLREFFGRSYYDIGVFTLVLSPVLQLLSLVILITIILLATCFNKTKRQCYQMPLNNHHKLLAFFFSALFNVPAMIMLFYFVHVPLFSITLYYFSKWGVELTDSMTIVISILPSLCTLLVMLISFSITFFSVKNCFKREFNTLPLKLLFKSTAWSYLYIVGFIIISNIILFFILGFVVGIGNTFMNEILLFVWGLLMLCAQLGTIVVIVIVPRKVVRKYFG